MKSSEKNKQSNDSQQAVQKRKGRPPLNLGSEPCAKDKLIETALRLFYRFGIHSVGVDRIVAESNVSKMTLFKYFPTKRDLVLEFLRVRDQRYSSWFHKTLDEQPPGKPNRLYDAVEVMKSWFKSPDFRGCAFINTTAESGPEYNEEKQLCSEHKKHLLDELEIEARKAGYKDPRQVADQLLIAIDGATIRAQMDGPEAGAAALESIAAIILSQV